MPSSRSVVLQLFTALAILGCCPQPGPTAPRIKTAAETIPHPELDNFRTKIDKAKGDKFGMCVDFWNGWIREVYCRQASEEWAKDEACCKDPSCTGKCAEAKNQFVKDCAVEVSKRIVAEVPDCAAALKEKQ